MTTSEDWEAALMRYLTARKADKAAGSVLKALRPDVVGKDGKGHKSSWPSLHRRALDSAVSDAVDSASELLAAANSLLEIRRAPADG